MSCPECERQKGCHGKNPHKALQIDVEHPPVIFHKIVIPATVGDRETMPPEDQDFRNVLLVYEADGSTYLYSSDGIPTLITDGDVWTLKLQVKDLQEIVVKHAEELEKLTNELAFEAAERQKTDQQLAEDLQAEAETRSAEVAKLTTDLAAETEAREAKDAELADSISAETTNREEADENLQSQVDALADRSDVVDVVGTHTELEAYDTKDLGDKDVVKVLNDETHDGAITYYRWDKTAKTWNYIGETGPYYTKSEIDSTTNGIRHDIENLTELMPAVVQETGDSERDVMSQKAVTEALAKAGGAKLYSEYGDNEDGALTQKFVSDKLDNGDIILGEGATAKQYSSRYGVTIGRNATGSYYSVVVGASASDNMGSYSTIIGQSAKQADSQGGGVAVGYGTSTLAKAVSIGYSAKADGQNVVAIGANATAGSGVAIGKSAQTSASQGYSNTAIGSGATATGTRSTALGTDAMATTESSVAVGYKSIAERESEVSFGDGSNVALYSTRYLANVRAGELDNDAVNLAQVRDMISEAGGGPLAYGLTGLSSASAATTKIGQYLNCTYGTSRLDIAYGSYDEDGEWHRRYFSFPNASESNVGLMKPADKTKLDSLLEIKSLNDSLSLDENGQLSVVGGGGDIPERAKNLPLVVWGGTSSISLPTFGTSWHVDGRLQLTTQFRNLDTGGNTPVSTVVALPFATSERSGLMAAEDKAKLDSIDPDAGGGGGSDIEVLPSYKSTVAENQVYSAVSMNNRFSDRSLIASTVKIGSGAKLISDTANGVAIGYCATAGNYSVAIGAGTNPGSNPTTAPYYGVAIGAKAVGEKDYGVALGARTSVAEAQSVAVGYSSASTRSAEVSFGDGSDNAYHGFRYLANVKDGELDQDAVTVHQLNEAVGNINTLLETLISGEGAK